MSDEDLQRLERQIDGLLGQYGALMQTQIRHDERIDEAKADRAEIRAELKAQIAAIRADMATMRADLLASSDRREQRTRELIMGVKTSCDAGWQGWEKWVEKFEKRQDTAKVSNRTVVLAMIGGSATVLAAMIAAAAAIITGGG